MSAVVVAEALSIFFLATLVHATVGFGTALVAMPLLALAFGVQTASPLVAFVVMTTSVLILAGSWRSMDFRAAWQFVLSSAAGIPIGLLVLKAAPEALVKGVLGVLLISFSVYSLVRPRMTVIRGWAWAYVFGFLAGILGGAYNTNGPPLILYGALRRWTPARFRATLQGYFFPTGLLIWLGHGISGLWTFEVLQLYLVALPAVLLAIFIGNHLNRRIPAHRFERLLYVFLIGLGGLLLV